MQSSSRALPFKQTLAGASPATDTILVRNSECRVRNWGTTFSIPCSTLRTPHSEGSQGVRVLHLSVRRRGFVVQVHVRAPISASVPQQPQGEFRKLVWWLCARTRCESDQRLQQGRDVTVSISACDADSAGANPVALTISTGPNELLKPAATCELPSAPGRPPTHHKDRQPLISFPFRHRET